MRFTSNRLVLAATPLLVAAFFAGRASAGDGQRLFQAVLGIVSRDAVEPRATEELYEMAARGLVKSLDDPYAGLQSREEFDRFSRNTLGNSYGGLGLRIVERQGVLAVYRVIPGGPAAAAGVRQGDRIVMVGDSTTAGWNVEHASRSLTGVPGTKVQVTFQRGRAGARYTRSFNRSVIRPASVPFVTMLPGAVGYLPLERFSDHSATDVASALLQLERAGARRLVLDLRGNPGGDLDQAARLAGLFLESGQTVVRVQYRHYADTLRADTGPVIRPSLPIAILVDSNSASASEIVAGALQDQDRALLVGTTSFGKGLVQGVYRLQDGWVLRLTSGHWYTPSGRLIQRTAADSARSGNRPVFHSAGGRTVLGGGGIAPDIEVYATPTPQPEQELAQRLNQNGKEVNQVLDRYAAELEGEVKPGFTIRPEWRTELVRRLRGSGIELDDSLAQTGRNLLDRLLAGRAGIFTDSDSSNFMRGYQDDAQLTRALELLRRAGDQRELYALADDTHRQG